MPPFPPFPPSTSSPPLPDPPLPGPYSTPGLPCTIVFVIGLCIYAHISLVKLQLELSELKSLGVRDSFKAGDKFRSRFHMHIKTFLHSNTLRKDETTFQYSFLYFSSILIAFLNYPVLFPTFPPTLQLRIITVRENGIYKKLFLILIDDSIVSPSSCIP